MKSSGDWNRTQKRIKSGKVVETFLKINGRWRSDRNKNDTDKEWVDEDAGTTGVFRTVFWHPGINKFVAIMDGSLEMLLSTDGNVWTDNYGNPIEDEVGSDYGVELVSLVVPEIGSDGFPAGNFDFKLINNGGAAIRGGDSGNPSEIIGFTKNMSIGGHSDNLVGFGFRGARSGSTYTELYGVIPGPLEWTLEDLSVALGENVTATWMDRVTSHGGIDYPDGAWEYRATKFVEGDGKTSTGTTFVFYDKDCFTDIHRYGSVWMYHIQDAIDDCHMFLHDNNIIVIPKGEKTDAVYWGEIGGDAYLNKAQLPMVAKWGAAEMSDLGGIIVAASNTDKAFRFDASNTGYMRELNLTKSADWSCMGWNLNRWLILAKDSDLVMRSTLGNDWEQGKSIRRDKWTDLTFMNGMWLAITEDSRTTQIGHDGINWKYVMMERDGVWTSVAGIPHGHHAVAGSKDQVPTIAHLDWAEFIEGGEFVEFEGELPENMIAWLYTFGTESLYMVTFNGHDPSTVNIYKLRYGVTDLSNLSDPVFTQTLDYSHSADVQYNTAFAGSDTVPGWHGSNVLVLAPAWPHNSYVYIRSVSQSITFDGSTFHVEHFDDGVDVAPNMGGIDGHFVFDEYHQFPKYALSFENGIMFEVADE
jgi:hypothetical protein